MNFNKRLFRIEDEEGVSEIVGTILTLSITVVLFSSIFAGVQYLETPEGTTFTELKASHDGDDNITVEHTGGKDLDTSKTSLFVLFDDTSHRFDFDSDNVTLYSEDSEEWTTGEKVELDVSDLSLTGVNFVELMVMDTSKSQVVWRTEVDIYSPLERPKIKDSGVIYPQEWNDYVEAGSSCKLYVDVEYPWEKIKDGDVNVLVNLRNLNELDENGAWDESWHNLTYQNGYRFTKKINLRGDQENGSYLLKVEVNNAGDNETIIEDFVKNGDKYSNENISWAKSEYIGLNVGEKSDKTENPDIVVDEGKIEFNPASPKNGDSFTTRATIENRGGTYAKFDVHFYDKGPDSEEKEEMGVVRGVSIAAGGGQDVRASWDINNTGQHKIGVEVKNISSPAGEDINPNNNMKNKSVYVAPTILLVDDDHEERGDANKMKGALEGADFNYEYYEVRGQNGPPLNKMNNFDIVIWMTGRTKGDENSDKLYERHPTLTDDDQDNIRDYLDAGNNLWLIGEGFADDSNIESSFVNDYLGFGINSLNSGEKPNPGADNDHRINGTGDILTNTTYPVYDRSYNGDYISSLSDADEMILNEKEGDIIGTNNENKDDKYKTAFDSFLFGSMKSGKSMMAYRVIKWFGNMTEKSGRDLAVSEQEFSTRNPMYRENVEITATIRNNGQFTENAEVRLYVNGELDMNQRERIELGPAGNSTDVTFDWTAEPVGRHELIVRVDPFNKIKETNELNNDITYQDYDPTINVQFSVLVVDDGNEDGADTLTNQLGKLQYSNNTVKLESDDDIPTNETMAEYNSVFWAAGEDSLIGDVNHRDTIRHVKAYLKNNSDVSFFLEGDSVLDDLKSLSEYGDEDIKKFYSNFIRNYLGIDNRTIDNQIDLELIQGFKENNFSHGMDYRMGGSSYQNMSVISGKALPALRNNGKVAGAMYDNKEEAFKTVTIGFGLSNITGPNVEEAWYEDFVKDVDLSAGPAREEFTYMLTKWFGNEDERTELRVSEVDIDVEVDNPMLGKSYRLTASIQNVGYKRSSALVRVKDGDSLVESESISVGGNSKHTIEVNWEPLFAGNKSASDSERNITIVVDPLCEEEEIRSPGSDTDDMAFNNVDVKRVPVFYFWDDMESGTRNWNHEAVLANINGESPIDYLGSGYENVYTDVMDEWDEGMSEGMNVTQTTSRTDPNSFWLTEPKAVNETKKESKPIDVVFALDTSGSMSGEIEDLKEATKNFIGMLEPKDRAAIYVFGGSYYSGNWYPVRVEDFAHMNQTNKDSFNSTIDSFTAYGRTPFYDTLGEAIDYSLTNDPDASDDSRLEFVVGMTDGVSNEDDDWTPKAEWGNETGDNTYGPDAVKNGLVKAPPMVYNVGLGINHDSEYPTAPEWSHNSPPDSDSYPVEYDVWNTADKTPWPRGKYGNRKEDAEDGDTTAGDPYLGHYYYTTDASQLKNIFENIRTIISEISEQAADEGNVTSVGSLNSNTLTGYGTDSLNYEWYDISGSNNEYANNESQMDNFFDDSNQGITFGGEGDHSSSVSWDDGNDYGTKPNYLPSNHFSWRAYGYIYAPETGEYTIGIDSDDASDVFIDGTKVADFYGSHAKENNYDHNGDITLDEGWHEFEARMQEWVGEDAISVAWMKPGYSSYSVISTDYFSKTPSGGDEDPHIVYTSPSDNKDNVSIDEDVTVVFSKPMDTDTVTYNCDPDSGGWSRSWSSNDQVLTLNHNPFEYKKSYTFEITGAEDKNGNSLDNSEGAPNPWSFTTISESGAGGGEGPQIVTGKNSNKTAVTKPLNLEAYSSAKLNFWHKYNIVPGTNGAFLQVGYYDDNDEWAWEYVVPTKGSYTGNMNLSVERLDDFGNDMDWAWNGVSGGGTFGWDYVHVSLLNYVPEGHREEVRVKFNYTQYGGGTGYGWYFDDVKIVGSRSMSGNVHEDMMDVWQTVNGKNDPAAISYDGKEDNTAWWNGYVNETEEKLKTGIDNSLISTPIDLTRANTAFLNADFKFNLNEKSGAPPDGFRVEVSTDNGVSWIPINDGSRSAMGLSGTDNTGDESYTGHDIGNHWVRAGTLSRLNVDLSGFSGETVMIRFRMVTNNIQNDDNYAHYEDESADFRGFYLDNVMVTGKSLQG
ncbi:MAG: CARDB domain-containing protein [Thermoplasmatota archaeon]